MFIKYTLKYGREFTTKQVSKQQTKVIDILRDTSFLYGYDFISELSVVFEVEGGLSDIYTKSAQAKEMLVKKYVEDTNNLIEDFQDEIDSLQARVNKAKNLL